jgi:hypothetical protein
MRMRPWMAAGLALALAVPAAPAGAAEPAFRPLFNRKDLTGWDTYLVKPQKTSDVPGLKKNEKGEYVEEIGPNKDPLNVFTVVDVDGKPALRVSGEVFGAVTSKEEFENYHFRVEFKWGEKKWPPREKVVRDSGLLYHCVGKPNGAGNGWMRSLEAQIQEHDCGDFYSVAGKVGPLVDVEGEKKGNAIVYKKGGEKFVGTKSRVIRDVDHEKPGAWNTIEVMCVGNVCVHLVNGKVNNVLTNPRYEENGKIVPMTRGKIQLQSEGAEVFYREMAVRPLDKIPDDLLK